MASKRKPPAPTALAKTHGPRPKINAQSLGRATARGAIGAIPVFGRVIDALRDAEKNCRAAQRREFAPRIVVALNGTTPRLFRIGSAPPQGADLDPEGIEVLASVLLG